MYAMAGLIPKKDALNQFGMQTITVLMIITLVLVIMMEVSLVCIYVILLKWGNDMIRKVSVIK